MGRLEEITAITVKNIVCLMEKGSARLLVIVYDQGKMHGIVYSTALEGTYAFTGFSTVMAAP